MQKISIAFLAAVSLASSGCSKRSSGSESIAKLTEFRDRMCGCKDRACTEKVTEDLTRWGQEQAKASGDKIVKMSDDDMKKSTAISGEMSTCMTKLLAEMAGAAGGGSAAAGAGGSAAPAGADGSAAAGSAH